MRCAVHTHTPAADGRLPVLSIVPRVAHPGGGRRCRRCRPATGRGWVRQGAGVGTARGGGGGRGHPVERLVVVARPVRPVPPPRHLGALCRVRRPAPPAPRARASLRPWAGAGGGVGYVQRRQPWRRPGDKLAHRLWDDHSPNQARACSRQGGWCSAVARPPAREGGSVAARWQRCRWGECPVGPHGGRGAGARPSRRGRPRTGAWWGGVGRARRGGGGGRRRGGRARGSRVGRAAVGVVGSLNTAARQAATAGTPPLPFVLRPPQPSVAAAPGPLRGGEPVSTTITSSTRSVPGDRAPTPPLSLKSHPAQGGIAAAIHHPPPPPRPLTSKQYTRQTTLASSPPHPLPVGYT